MVNAERLLADLERLRKKLDDDLRRHHAASPGRAAVEAEWREARENKRTADTFETFFGAAVDQASVHWILALVFLRFLEDNRLLDRPLIAGPGERLELAQLRMRDYFATRPADSEAEYLLAVFADVARLPGLGGLYDADHNPLFRLPVSGDGAIALFTFFRDRDPTTGALRHDFSDPDGNTRFLGDLYQDLSEDARKRFALLQTPDFVEAWILARTLDPAISEFGIDQVRMIDPTCGSGHFLLGGFARLLEAWRRHAPEMPPAAQAQHALDAVAGVDLNPFAVEIARFRLLVAALRAAGEARLAAAPDFRLQLATGDSLLHGRHFFRRELGGAEAGFRRVLRHHYAAEDTAALEAILGRQYHAVVGNPPYITPKDAAMRDAYREIYESCHMKYGLGAPFTERFFDLAQEGTADRAAGFVGLIVANSFMKREFGRKLIEGVLPRLDLTHVVDCSGAYIPGHGTPTAILFGRNRAPVASVVRTVRGIRGEPAAPDDPARGLVWSAIVAQTDSADSASDFVSTEDTERAALARHPWNMGGGGAAEVQEAIEEDRPRLSSVVHQIGFSAVTGADEVFAPGSARDLYRLLRSQGRPFVTGEDVRDYRSEPVLASVWLYDTDFHPVPLIQGTLSFCYMWPFRTTLCERKLYGQPILKAGLRWYEYGEVNPSKQRIPKSIAFGFVVTHNHFVFDRGGKVFSRSAPVIKLPATATDDDHLGLLGLLNSSAACFWMKQIFHNKGSTVDERGARQRTDPFEDFYEITGTGLLKFPLTAERPLDLARALDTAARRLTESLPAALCARAIPTRDTLDAARAEAEASRKNMIAVQEELDWRCYRLYALHDAPPEHANPPPLALGERAFEIVMARRMADGDLQTAWFERHRSTPVTDLPAHWPDDYRDTVARRIALVESDPTIGLIERPEYKRRWSAAPWEEMERDALRDWLLDRLEEARLWPRDAPQILSARALADAARHDAEFRAVADLYAGRAGFDLDALVAELVAGEAVPFLAALRYSEAGLRKRADWEATWDRQRAEDAIDAKLAANRDEFLRAARARMTPPDRHASEGGHPGREVAVAAPSNPLPPSFTGGEGRVRGEEPQAPTLDAPTPPHPSPLPQAGEGEMGACDRPGDPGRAPMSDAEVAAAADAEIAREAKRRKADEVGDIPVPPKYRTPDFQSQTYWRLRGGLDVPKERFVSFPPAARDADPSLPVLWAGHDHLARARALAAWYVDRKETDGWGAARLAPLLAGLLELLPWLRQWHNDLDPDTGLRMGDFFDGYVDEQARDLGLTRADLRAWTPPAPVRGRRGRRASA